MRRTAGGSTALPASAAAIFVLALVAVPLLVVEFVPVHDLPQHLAQARLFTELGGRDSPVYDVHWMAPHLLIYALLLPLWWLLPPMAAGKAFVFLLLAVSVSALFRLAHVRQRPVEAAVLASLFLLNVEFYAGFFAFQLGGALFFLWLARRDAPPSRRTWPADAAWFALLAWAHALWLGCALAVAAGRAAARHGARGALVRGSAAIPALAWTVPSTLATVRARAAAELPVAWEWADLWTRLGPAAWLNAPLGGLQGWMEPAVLVAALVWVVWAWLRPADGEARDRLLLGVAAFFAGLWLVLPDSMAMTIHASRRWVPYAIIFLILGLPVPRLERRRLRGAVAVLWVAFAVRTALAWRFYDRAELAGFREALEHVQEGDRLMGLGFLRSRELRGDVFAQTYAWAEVLRGAELATSFTEFGAGLVLRRTPRPRPWTRFLDFFPWTVRPSDFQHFDLVLAGGEPDIHRQLAATGRLRPLTDGLPWRIYRVVR